MCTFLLTFSIRQFGLYLVCCLPLLLLLFCTSFFPSPSFSTSHVSHFKSSLLYLETIGQSQSHCYCAINPRTTFGCFGWWGTTVILQQASVFCCVEAEENLSLWGCTEVCWRNVWRHYWNVKPPLQSLCWNSWGPQVKVVLLSLPSVSSLHLSCSHHLSIRCPLPSPHLSPSVLSLRSISLIDHGLIDYYWG